MRNLQSPGVNDHIINKFARRSVWLFQSVAPYAISRALRLQLPVTSRMLIPPWKTASATFLSTWQKLAVAELRCDERPLRLGPPMRRRAILQRLFPAATGHSIRRSPAARKLNRSSHSRQRCSSNTIVPMKPGLTWCESAYPRPARRPDSSRFSSGCCRGLDR
jgi:hypothetical protein